MKLASSESGKVLQVFPYSVGENFKRADLHSLFGGSFRHGMTSANHGRDFLLFHDDSSSREFGYDVWEGFQADGSFHYTGQGTKGDQKMTRSNLSLVRANSRGVPIHLIESTSGICTYIGRYVLGIPNYFIRQAPDVEKRKVREVFVFNLMPISNTFNEDGDSKGLVIGEDQKWVEPDLSSTIKKVLNQEETSIDFAEMRLQAEFGNYLISKGIIPLIHNFTLTDKKGVLKPDFWLPSMGLVVEAKPTSTRDHVRLAIGQVLDYANLARLEGKTMIPAILLPARPSKDLCELIASLGITLITKLNSGFDFSEPPN